MPEYIVTRKTDGAEMLRYSAASPREVNGCDLNDYDHTEWFPDEGQVTEQINPVEWRIHVGDFFDRFGSAKLGVLSSPNALVQAFITDVSVREYIALHERRADIEDALDLLLSLGHQIDKAAILDVKPAADEVWNG